MKLEFVFYNFSMLFWVEFHRSFSGMKFYVLFVHFSLTSSKSSVFSKQTWPLIQSAVCGNGGGEAVCGEGDARKRLTTRLISLVWGDCRVHLSILCWWLWAPLPGPVSTYWYWQIIEYRILFHGNSVKNTKYYTECFGDRRSKKVKTSPGFIFMFIFFDQRNCLIL